MTWLTPVTLKSTRVTLTPLADHHVDDLREAVADGELWNLWYTHVVTPDNMAVEIQRRLKAQADGSMLPFSVIDNTLRDLNQIATQARIVPSFRNGVANGFKLFSIQPGSLYASIGVENGDVIQRINGYEINSPDKALEVYQKLRSSSHITIELERNGRPVRKEYNVTGP